MKSLSRKIVSLTLIMMLVLSSFSFAGVSSSLDNSELLKLIGNNSVKISDGLQKLDVKDDEVVRVIVELKNEPIINYATQKGIKVSQLSERDINKLSTGIQAEQDAVLEEIENESVQTEVLNRFENVFNGFSMNVEYGQIEKIASLENVKKVYVANRYDRPEPQMSNSEKLTQSKYVNEQLKNTGKGIVVAIIDSGLDPSHKDFKLDSDATKTLTEENIGSLVVDKSLPGKFYTDKVPYGYNYMDKNGEIRDLGADASMHGMHVGGTVGANGTLKGVAPNVQLLGMKVFGNDPEMPSTFGDIIVKAIDDSIALGADVMNLSLGSSAAFVDPEDPEQKAVARAVDNGIVMSISAGNSAYYGNGYDLPLVTNPDIGVVGAPGVSNDSLQVASVDNFGLLYNTKVEADGLDMEVVGYGKDDWAGVFDKDEVTLVTIGGNVGNPDDFKGVDVKGKVVLVKRGSLTFVDKTENAFAAGAKGIIVYNNNINAHFYKDQGGWSIPFMKVNVDEGAALEKLIADNGGEVTIKIADVEAYVNPVTGELSDFSSWGVTPNMDFKPEISAPGGNIYSTFNDDKYGFMSGTSMAAPHVAGGSALMIDRINNDEIFSAFKAKNKDKAELAKNILMNTARPVKDNYYSDDNGVITGHSYTSVRRQGAGSMDLKSAMETTVVVTEKTTGIAKVLLGEMENKASFDLIAKNFGKDAVKYDIGVMAQTNDYDDGYNLLTSEMLKGAKFNVTVGGKVVNGPVEIAGNSQIEIHVDIDLTNAKTSKGDDILTAFPNGNFVEGYVFLYTKNTEASNTETEKSTAFENAKKAVDEKSALVDELATKVTDAAVSVALVDEEIEALDAEFNKAVDENASLSEKYNAITDAKSDLDDAQAIYQGLLDDNKDMDLDKDLEELNTLKNNKADSEAKIETLNTEIAALETELSGLEAESEEFKAKQAEIDAKQADLEAENATLATLVTDIEAKEVVVADNTEIATSIDNANKAVSEAEKAYNAAVEGLTDVEKAAYDEYVVVLSTINTKINAKKAEKADLDKALADITDEYNKEVKALELLEAALETATDDLNVAKEDNFDVLPLSVPYLGFYGDWGKAPAFEGLRDSEDSFYNLTGLYTESPVFEDFLGANSKGKIVPELISFSPNGDKIMDNALPILSVNRNVENVEFNILNKDKTLLRTLGREESMRKTFYDGGEGKRFYYLSDYAWDGTINGTMAADGQYYYEIKGTLADGTVHTLRLPLKLDNTKPVIDRYTYKNGGDTLTVFASDSTAGISKYVLSEVVGEELVPVQTSLDGVFKISELEHRGYQVRIAVVDNAGNIAENDNDIALNDSHNPEIKLPTIEAFSTINTKEFVLKGEAVEMNKPTITVDGEKVVTTYNEAANKYEFSKSYKYEEDGKKGIVVLAEDNIGNKLEFIRHFYIDSTPAVLNLTSDVALDATHKTVVANNVEKINFKGNVTDTLFPNLIVSVNGDVIYRADKDYVSYENLMVGAKYDFERTLTLKDGINKFVVEVTDAGGNVTKEEQTIIRLDKDGKAPYEFKIAELKLDAPEAGVSYDRSLNYSAKADVACDWVVDVINPRGEKVATFTDSAKTEISGTWAPERNVKLNGEFKVVVSAKKGETTVKEEKTFEVYNYQFLVNKISKLDRAGMLNIVVDIENLDDKANSPLVVVQIRRADGTVLSINTAQSKVNEKEKATLSTGIQMPKNGSYTAEVFVWDKWDESETLAQPQTKDAAFKFDVE